MYIRVVPLFPAFCWAEWNQIPDTVLKDLFASPPPPPYAVKLEKDVKEALLAIAKQKGKVDPNVREHASSILLYILELCVHVYRFVDGRLMGNG